MCRPLTLTAQAPGGTENEDAVVADDGVVVVVDGAGLPAHLRTGCRHSVAWFARSVAHTFHALLVARSSSMRDALAETIRRVKDSHATTCSLAGGSPSATVAAWRMADDQLEYLVLSDASIVLLDRHDRATEIVDHRLENMIARAAPLDPKRPAVTGAQVRAARRAAVESARNKPGGFWCVQTDTSAAVQAMHGAVPVRDLTGVVACSDGGARAYELLGAHTLEEFTNLALRGELETLSDTIRTAENNQAGSLQRWGLKVHDDITIVALPLTNTFPDHDTGPAMTIGDDYAGSDFYCDVAIPHATELTVVHNDDHVLAFHHTKPHWETHVVIVPKRHIASLTSATSADTPALQALFAVVQNIARHVEEREGAAAVLTNLGAYQDSKHLHIHVHSGPRTHS